MTDYFFVLVGGAFGAVCRFAISSLIKRSISSEFPIATLLINMIGSFLIGLLVAAHSGNLIQLLLGIGFMGGFTTFSTFQFENISLFRNKNYLSLSIYVISSLISCILLAILGLHMGQLFNGLLQS